jgi:hypothetical protein
MVRWELLTSVLAYGGTSLKISCIQFGCRVLGVWLKLTRPCKTDEDLISAPKGVKMESFKVV